MTLRKLIENIIMESNGIVYHGTNNKFSSFNDTKPIFFSDDIKVAKSYGSTIIAAKLDLKNPLEVDFEGSSTVYFVDKFYVPSAFAEKVKDISNDIEKYGMTDEFRDIFVEYDWSNMYGELDGIIMKNIKDSYGDIFAGNIIATNYVVFNKNQIKIQKS